MCLLLSRNAFTVLKGFSLGRIFYLRVLRLLFMREFFCARLEFLSWMDQIVLGAGYSV